MHGYWNIVRVHINKNTARKCVIYLGSALSTFKSIVVFILFQVGFDLGGVPLSQFGLQFLVTSQEPTAVLHVLL